MESRTYGGNTVTFNSDFLWSSYLAVRYRWRADYCITGNNKKVFIDYSFLSTLKFFIFLVALPPVIHYLRTKAPDFLVFSVNKNYLFLFSNYILKRLCMRG